MEQFKSWSMNRILSRYKGSRRGNRSKTMEVLNVLGEWTEDYRAKGMVKQGLKIRNWVGGSHKGGKSDEKSRLWPE